MISVPASSFSAVVVVSSLEKPISSDCYLHDAVKALQSIRSIVETLDKRDVSSTISFSDLLLTKALRFQSTRYKLGQLVQDVATFLYTFCEEKYTERATRHLSFALAQLWLKYRDQVIRYVHPTIHLHVPTLMPYLFPRLLSDFDAVVKRQARAGLFQRRLGSSNKTSADVARITVSLGDLSMSSMVCTHNHYYDIRCSC